MKIITEKARIDDIADAVRQKLNVETQYKLSEIPAAIDNIYVGGELEPLSATANGDYTPGTGIEGFSRVHVAVPGPTLVTKNVVSNGTYNASQDNADGYSSVNVNVPGGVTVETLEVTENGTYNPPSGVDGYAPVTVNVSGGSKNLYTNGQISTEQITDVTGFTLLYNGAVMYGNYGQKVATRLAITDESAHSTLQARGWNTSGMCFYDAENLIGAYGGYDFGQEIPVEKVKFWLNRYSGQNKTLIATIEYLDRDGNWNEIQDLEITNNMSYPSYVFEVTVNRSIYGIRWIHKKEPIKTGGNNITFAGMSVYRTLGQPTNVYIPDSSGLIMPPTGYDGFGPLYIT